MKNVYGLTAYERILKDIELAELAHGEHKQFLAHSALGAAEFAIDFGLLTYKEWGELTRKVFDIM